MLPLHLGSCGGTVGTIWKVLSPVCRYVAACSLSFQHEVVSGAKVKRTFLIGTKVRKMRRQMMSCVRIPLFGNRSAGWHLLTERAKSSNC